VREHLLRSLIYCIESCIHGDDCTSIMSEQAVEDARTLIRAIGNSPEDIRAQSVVGQLHWIRYELGKSTGVGEFEADRRVAIAHLSPVHAEFPDAVPDEAREYLDERQDWGIRASALIDQGPLPGGLMALDEAVELLQRIVLRTTDDDPMLPNPLTELAVALEHRFQLAQQIEDLQTALMALEKAISLTHVDDPQRLNRESLLKLFVVARYDHRGDVKDLDEAIRIGHKALDTAPSDHPQLAAMTADLMPLYKRRYDRTMAITDLDIAVSYGRRALNLPIDDDERRASIKDALGIVLRRRGERTGDRDSLESAVILHRDAVNVIPTEHHDWLGICNNLGLALQAFGEITDDSAQLRESVEVLQYVVKKSKERGHPDLPGFLQNVGISQNILYRASGDLSDLRGAVDSLRESAVAFEGPLARGALSDFGNALYELSEATDDLMPLNEAVEVHRRAVGGSAPGDPATALMQVNLAAALRARYGRTHATEDRTEAIRYFRAHATLNTTPPSLRLRAARSWGRLEADAGNWPAADIGLGLAVELLSRIAGQNLRRGDQERHLRREPGLISGAVAAALEIGDIDRAAVLFEQGRGVLTAHALNLRTDLDRLSQKDKRMGGAATEYPQSRRFFGLSYAHDRIRDPCRSMRRSNRHG
jgi:tetratricopeptide (TPR) repeat protein